MWLKHPLKVLPLISTFALATPHSPSHGNSGGEVETIMTDICVIGGGSSGTHAAIRLQQEGKKVVLVEKQDRLGGHVDTYRDPATSRTFDHGVQIFSNISVVRDYFSHFNIPLAPIPATQSSTLYANFKTGAFAYNKTLVDESVAIKMLAYEHELAKYPGITQDPTWNLTYPVPEDLLLDWGDFIKKYKLEAFAYAAFSYQQGFGNLLAQPTIYQMRLFDRLQVSSILTPGGFLVNALQDNQLLYDRAQAELGKNVFVGSKVMKVKRKSEGVEVTISTPEGKKLVKAKKLLMAIPPKVDILKPFLDLSKDENNVFRQFNNSYYWTAIIRNTGLDDTTSIANVDPAAPLDLPALPGVYSINPTGIPGARVTYFSSPYYLSTKEVEKRILETAERVRKGLGYAKPKGKAKIVSIGNHSPFELTVSKDAIRKGFYRKLEALQGRKNTWWTGATFNKHASHAIWQFNELVVLPALLA